MILIFFDTNCLNIRTKCIFYAHRPNDFRWREWKSLFSRASRYRSHGFVHMRSRNLDLFGKMAWSQLRHHLLRQHRPGHVDGFPMCQHGGLDAHSIFGKSYTTYINAAEAHRCAACVCAAWRGADSLHGLAGTAGSRHSRQRRWTIKGCSSSNSSGRSLTQSELQKVCL